MSSERVAARFGLTLEQAREALKIQAETGRELVDIARQIRGIASSESATRELPRAIGKYEILSLLGRGGGGLVYRVRNPSIGRIEALKLLKDEGDSTLEDRARFERETRVLGQLNHPNIVPIFEVGQVEGRPYYTMECIQGESVADVLRRMGSLPPRAAMIVARDAGKALAAAHERGIIHRDIKPHNILIAPETHGEERADRESTLALSAGAVTRFRVLLSDFGLARVSGEQSLTQETGTIVGTLMYMAPEQVNAERARVNERSDLYSVGATLYQMLTGKLPFEGDTVLAMQIKITCEDPVAIRVLKPGISRDIETIVMKCLEKDQDRRYGSAKELVEDIDRYLRGEVIRARPVGLTYRLYRKARRYAALFLTAIAAMLATVVAVLFFTVLPALRERKKDRALLEAAILEKRAREAEFAVALRDGRYEEAVSLGSSLFRRRPEIPPLKVPSRADDPAFDELRREYRVDLPAAFLGRARERLRSGNPKARLDLANAYRSSLESGGDAAGREALLLLGQELESAGDATGALAMYRLCESRFPPTPESITKLAGALEREGLIEEAAARWKRIGGEEADRRLGLLRALLPRRDFAVAEGKVFAGDIDGDGRDELFHLSVEGVLAVYRFPGNQLSEVARLPLGYPTTQWDLQILDADGDGTREIVIGGGVPRLQHGRLFVVSWNGGRPKVVASDESLKTFVTHSDVADVDRDGIPELVVATSYFERALRFYRYRDGTLKLLGAPLEIGCDPEHFAFLDGRLFLHVGPWDQKGGFRALLLAFEEGRVRKVAETVERFHSVQWTRIGEREWLLTTLREPQESLVVPELAPPGLYRLDVRDDRFGELRRLAGPWPEDPRPSKAARLVAGGGPVFAVLHDKTVHLVPEHGGEARRLALPRLVDGFTSADIDGDREPELLVMGLGILEVWGLGDSEVGIAQGSAKSTAGGVGRGTAGNDMLEAGLYREAEDLFRGEVEKHPKNARARYGLGTALAGQGEYRAAAVEFAEAAKDPSLSVEAGLRRAHALQSARDWMALKEAVEFLESTPGLDPFAREETARLREWAFPAARMRRVVDVSSWGPEVPLLCENPCEARIRDGELEVWDNSGRPSTTGLAVHLDGGPFRLRMRVRYSRPEWESGIRIGLIHASLLSSPRRERERAGPALFLHHAGGGASDKTNRFVWWRAIDRTGLEHKRDLLTGERGLEEHLWYTFDLEAIPGLDRAFVRLTDDEGRDAFPPLTVPLPFRPDRGLYQVGSVRETLQTIGVPGRYARCRIASIQIEASTSTTRLTHLEPSRAVEALLVANGLLVAGAPAREAYDRALKWAADSRDRATLWRAHLFHALCLLRSGDATSARAEVRRAVQAGGDVRGLLDGSSKALTDEERNVLRSAAEEF